MFNATVFQYRLRIRQEVPRKDLKGTEHASYSIILMINMEKT